MEYLKAIHSIVGDMEKDALKYKEMGQEIPIEILVQQMVPPPMQDEKKEMAKAPSAEKDIDVDTAPLPKFFEGVPLTPTPQVRKMSSHCGRVKPLTIGICGGQTAGKSHLVYLLRTALIGRLAILEQGMFYKPPAKAAKNPEIEKLPEDKKDQVKRKLKYSYNFDEPDAVDWEMFGTAIDTLIARKPYKAPFFDQNTKVRIEAFTEILPSNVIIVDGTMILYNEMIRKKIDIKIFVEADEDVRLSRRILKHMPEFNEDKPENTVEDLGAFLENYFTYVKYAFENYIEPSKKYADIIIPNYGFSVEPENLGEMEFKDSSVNLILSQIEVEINKK